MLFNALIERLLGDETQDWKDQERSKTSRFSYYAYPNLAGILSDLLTSPERMKQSNQETADTSSPLDLHGAEGVFPALQILRQARPPEEILESISKSVEVSLGSPHWHLRDMAARTVVSMRLPSELFEAGLSQLSNIPQSENARHGTLLCVKYTFQRLLRDPEFLSKQDACKLMWDMRDANFS